MTKKVLILGSARSGKDTFAELLCQFNPNLSFKSSSFFVCEKAVFPTLSEKYGYKTIEECYEDRDSHRVEWFDLISKYNDPKYRLASEILAEHSMYVGLRNRDEYEACQEKSLFDIVFWVDGTQRTGVVESRQSFNIDYDPLSMFLIDNNRPLVFLDRQAKEWAAKL